MFAATITLTLNSVAKVLNRVNQDNLGSTYTLVSATERFSMLIRHTTENSVNGAPKIDRHNIFVERWIYATPTTAEEYYSYTATFRCYQTSDPTKLGYLVRAVVDWLDTASVVEDLAVGIN
jgi:hypothetical protein